MLARAAKVNHEKPLGAAGGLPQIFTLPAWAESQLPDLSLTVSGDESQLIF